MDTNRFAFLNRPPLLRGALILSWTVFIGLGVLLAAFCFSYLFLPVTLHLPLNIWFFLMAAAGIKLLMVVLSSLHQRAALEQRKQDPNKARQHFRWALRLTPGNPDLYCEWAQLEGQQDEFEQANRLLEQAQFLSPSYDEPDLQWAYLALKQLSWLDANRHLDRAYRLRRGIAWNDLPERIPDADPAEPIARRMPTSLSKLRHDLEQLTFLLDGDYLTPSFRSLQQAYQQLLEQLQAQARGQQDPYGRVILSKAEHASIYLAYGRNYYISPVPAFPRSVLHPDLKPEQLQQAYQDSEHGLIWFDNLLQPDACEALLHFCQKSSIWHDDTRPGGYLGAYLDDGFHCALLFQLAAELRKSFPAIFKGAPLKHMWAYKYDGQQTEGIGVHADDALINVNFWLTPDHANLDPDGGGLIVYDCETPADWSFKDYNHDTAKTQAYLEAHSAGQTVIPYRQNRVTIFNSRLFHASAPLHFKDDYLLRRINVTLLFGKSN